MKFFWFSVIFLTFCFACEVLSDYSEATLPSKEIRNRVHRTMRVNMRVGKRFGDSEYDEEAPKRRFRLRVRTGKRTFNELELPEIGYTEPQFNTNQFNTDTSDEESVEVDKQNFLNPNRPFRLVGRSGKRKSGNPERAQFYGETNHDGNVQDNHMTGYKRSSPQFLLNPRVGKNDKDWKFLPLENIHKRSDPKASDLWFGPRIGRSNNNEQFEETPWSYLILNGNRLMNVPTFKSNDLEQSNEDSTF